MAMKKFHLLINPDSTAYVIVSENSLDYIDYIGSGFVSLNRGNKKECLRAIEDHWGLNDTPPEQRIYAEHK